MTGILDEYFLTKNLFKEVVLTREQIYAQFIIDPLYLSPDVRLRVEQDTMGRLIYQLRDFVTVEKLESHTERVQWSEPATWWEHLKVQYKDTKYLGWWLRKLKPPLWKISYKDVEWQAKALFPRAHEVLGDWTRHEQILRFPIQTDVWSTWDQPTQPPTKELS